MPEDNSWIQLYDDCIRDEMVFFDPDTLEIVYVFRHPLAGEWTFIRFKAKVKHLDKGYWNSDFWVDSK